MITFCARISIPIFNVYFCYVSFASFGLGLERAGLGLGVATAGFEH